MKKGGAIAIAKKKKENIRISFVDSISSEDVTGSMVLVTTPHHKILLDAGLHQSNDRYEDFLINNRKFSEFKPKDLDFCFISHVHSDHVSLLPKLYKMGFCGATIVGKSSKIVMADMLYDCAEINMRDVLLINTQKSKNYNPLYEPEDVDNALQYVLEYDINKKIYIDDELSFELVPSGHLLGSCQILLYLTVDNITKTILYTGDLGNKKINNKFVGKYQQVKHADLVIGETTYGDRPDLHTGVKERTTDLAKLKSIIDMQIKEMHGRVIVPSFAQSRIQQLCLMIYELYKDSNWKPTVYVDSPLSIKIFEDYKECLYDDDKKIFDELLASGFINFIKEPIDSKALVQSNEPCLILSTAGMCQVGRIRHHLKRCIPDSNSTILFVGFATEGSLGALLKDHKRKSVTIDQKEYTCRCAVSHLHSMSGHAPFDQLIDDYASIQCQKIVLHHGSKQAKETLKGALEKELSKRCNTARVVIANSSLKFSL